MKKIMFLDVTKATQKLAAALNCAKVPFVMGMCYSDTVHYKVPCHCDSMV